MSYKKIFTVPDYYPEFACKCGECRHTCCQLWKVTMSIEEYDRLIGLKCSPELRKKLDGAMSPLPDSTPERYASMIHRPDGFCHMLLDSGYCALHREMGEETIPSVCRYYPRSPRLRFSDECSCSCGCEAVVEELMRRETPVGLTESELEFELVPEPHDGQIPEEEYLAIRGRCFAIMSDPSVPLQTRMIRLGEMIFGKESDPAEPDETDRAAAFALQTELNDIFGRTSANLGDYAVYASEYYAGTLSPVPEEADWLSFLDGFSNRTFVPPYTELILKYGDAVKKLLDTYPQLDRMLGNVIVNHIFYTSFPYSDPTRPDAKAAFCELTAVYGLIRYLLSACLSTVAPDDPARFSDLADIISAAFRMIEGSEFVVKSPLVFRKNDIVDLDTIAKLIRCF